MQQTEQLKSANTPNPPDSSTLLEVEEVGDEVPPWEDHTPHGEASTLKALSGPRRSISPNGRSEARMRAIFSEVRGSGSSLLKGCSLLLRERQWLLGRSFPGVVWVGGNIVFGRCGLGTSSRPLQDLSLFCHSVHFHGDVRWCLGVESRRWGRRGRVPALQAVTTLGILHTGHHVRRSAPLEVRVIECRVLGGFHVGWVSREEVIDITGGVMGLKHSVNLSTKIGGRDLCFPDTHAAVLGPVQRTCHASNSTPGATARTQ
jgi:hypothetical protein